MVYMPKKVLHAYGIQRLILCTTRCFKCECCTVIALYGRFCAGLFHKALLAMFHFMADCIPCVFRRELTHATGGPCCFAPASPGPSIGAGIGVRASFSEGRSPAPSIGKYSPAGKRSLTTVRGTDYTSRRPETAPRRAKHDNGKNVASVTILSAKIKVGK